MLRMKRKSQPLLLTAGLVLASLPVFAIEPPPGSSAPPPAPSAPAGPAAATPGENLVPAPPRPAPAAPSAPRAEARQAAAYLGVGGYRAPELLALHLGLKPGEGMVVHSLDPAGPAAAAGFVQNDILLRVDGVPVGSREDLTRLVQAKKPGDAVKIDFIHEGKPGDRLVTLGTRQDGPLAAGPPGAPLDRMLQNLPQDQANRIRESIERSLRDADGAEDLLEDMGPHFDEAIDGMRKRAEKLLEGAGGPPGEDAGFSSASSIRLLDEQGSVELKSRNGGKEVRVLDKQGKEVWSGPWNTDQDKSAAPKEVRERVERLNVDMDSGGLRLKLGPKPEGR
jgi:hypothetical protein